MNIQPLQFYKCLSDETRLSCVLLISKEQELCVCELTGALEVSQPKISRHLAQLREGGLLQDRREGQWIYYKINPALPGWATEIIAITLRDNEKIIKPLLRRLRGMGDRPLRKAQCC
jgi:ArsR family transcriptional regulator